MKFHLCITGFILGDFNGFINFHNTYPVHGNMLVPVPKKSPAAAWTCVSLLGYESTQFLIRGYIFRDHLSFKSSKMKARLMLHEQNRREIF